MFDGERSGFGISVRKVLCQEGGGVCPDRMELKRERRLSAISEKKVLYHSYGMPSGPGDLRSGNALIVLESSVIVKGVVRS